MGRKKKEANKPEIKPNWITLAMKSVRFFVVFSQSRLTLLPSPNKMRTKQYRNKAIVMPHPKIRNNQPSNFIVHSPSHFLLALWMRWHCAAKRASIKTRAIQTAGIAFSETPSIVLFVASPMKG